MEIVRIPQDQWRPRVGDWVEIKAASCKIREEGKCEWGTVWVNTNVFGIITNTALLPNGIMQWEVTIATGDKYLYRLSQMTIINGVKD